MIKEVLVAILLILLLLVIFNPLQVWIPGYIEIILVIGLLIVFGLFVSFVVTDKSRSEHRLLADRMGFLIGAGIMVVGILAQSFKHNIDDWLIVGLAAMLIAKVVGILYRPKA